MGVNKRLEKIYGQMYLTQHRFISTIMVYTVLYIDPGSGSYFLQAIIAAVLGGLMFFKNFWISIKSFFVKQKPKDDFNKDELREKENI